MPTVPTMRFRLRPALVPALLAALAAAACGKTKPTEPLVATHITVVAGSPQTGQVGLALPVKLRVLAGNSQGPVAGASLHAAPQNQSSGSVSPENTVTDASGAAEFTWTLGGQIGAQGLVFTSGTLPPASATASGTVGPAASVIGVSDIFQFSVVSRSVTSVPSVRVTDAFGNPIAGLTVTFEATVPGSVLTGTEQVSSAAGIATVGSWTIGPDAVSYGARATISGGAAAVFEARGIPATVTLAAGNGQTANTGTALPVAPAVRAARDDASPLPGVTVTYLVTGGGGIIQDATATTGSDGIARPTRWILGTVGGPNLAEARVLGRNPVVFTATGVPTAPANLIASSVAAQSAFFGNFVTTPPSVTVRDLAGNPVAGATVVFAVSQGDGQLTGAAAVSDFLGRASLHAWRLGAAAAHGLSATSGGLPPVAFTATASAPPVSTFNLEVRFVNAPTSAQQAAFDQAVARWKQIVLAGGAPYLIAEPAFGPCPAMNETVSGLVIHANLRNIDGVGGILGQAGPCILRDDPTYLPAMGIMDFDTSDLAGLEASGRLNDVILHEMGHVLGFGTIWNFNPFPGVLPANAFLTGPGTGDPVFNGPASRTAFLAAVAPGRTFTGVPVPVENTGGGGTRDAHWRESIMTTELMTGFISAIGTANPLSAFTAATFRDMGYLVNDAPTDPFTFLAVLRAGAEAAPFELREGRITVPLVVKNRQGQTVARIPRQ